MIKRYSAEAQVVHLEMKNTNHTKIEGEAETATTKVSHTEKTITVQDIIRRVDANMISNTQKYIAINIQATTKVVVVDIDVIDEFLF